MTWMIWGVSQWLRKPRSHDNLAKKILLTSIHTLLDYEPANKSRPWTPIPLKLAKFREPHGCQRTKHCKQLQTSKIPLVTSPYLAISLRWSVVQGPVTRHVGDLSAIHNHDFFTSGFSFQSQQRWKANFFSGLGMVNVPKNWGILNTSHQISGDIPNSWVMFNSSSTYNWNQDGPPISGALPESEVETYLMQMTVW